MEKKITLLKTAAVVLIGILISASYTAAVIKENDHVHRSLFENMNTSENPLTLESSEIWEDEFNDESRIDPDPPGIGRSENYQVANGEVTMINTYPAWTDPSWTKMKPVTLTNNMGYPLSNHLLYLTITYEAEMQPDYDDIRFKHEDYPLSWLDYWIESKNATTVNVWVTIPSIPTGESILYLFYGNPMGTSQSDFTDVFTWQAQWGDDEKVTNHGNVEGTWDPDISFGNNEFLIAWEEGQSYAPPYTWGFKQEIRGSIYDPDGIELVIDELIYRDTTFYYRNENPSSAYGGGKYFVAWEHYDTVANPSYTTMDIKARTVQRSGSSLSLGTVKNICTASNCQADPFVTFDSINNQFCVAWEDALEGTSDYDLWARLYDTSGNPVTS
jgi:hypothetical protein